MRYSRICLVLPTLVSSLHSDRVGLDVVVQTDEAGGPHPKRGEILPHPPSTPRPPSEKRPEAPTRKPRFNPLDPWNLFGKTTTPQPAAPAPVAAAPKRAQASNNPFLNPEVKARAAARLDGYVQKLRNKKEAVMKQVEQDNKVYRWPFAKKPKKKGVRIMTLSELFGLPTVEDFNTFFATANGVTDEATKASEVAVKAMENITENTRWLPEVLPQVSTALEKIATPFGGPRTPPYSNKGADYDVEKLAVEIVKKKQMLNAIKGGTGGGDESNLESATSMFCQNQQEAILAEGKKAEIVKLTLIGDSIYESFKGTTCGIPLKGICEATRPDKRGCEKETKFKKFFSNEFAPPVNPQRQSMVAVTDEFPQYLPGIKPLILASGGMRFQEVTKLVEDLLEEKFHSAVYSVYVGLNNLLDQEGMELAEENFKKMAKFMKANLPYSVVMLNLLLPCPKCVTFGVTDETIIEFNDFMVKYVKELDATGPRRFFIVDCAEAFMEDEKAAEEMSEAVQTELPPKLMSDGKHPNKLGHEQWLKCWGPKVDAAVVAMKAAGLTKDLVIEDAVKNGLAFKPEDEEKTKLAKTIVGPDGIPLTPEEVELIEATGNASAVLANKTNATTATKAAAPKSAAKRTRTWR